jgi:hypothetical protein
VPCAPSCKSQREFPVELHASQEGEIYSTAAAATAHSSCRTCNILAPIAELRCCHASPWCMFVRHRNWRPVGEIMIHAVYLSWNYCCAAYSLVFFWTRFLAGAYGIILYTLQFKWPHQPFTYPPVLAYKWLHTATTYFSFLCERDIDELWLWPRSQTSGRPI